MDHVIWRGDSIPEISPRLNPRKNAGLQGSMGSEPPQAKKEPSKSTLVEITTPTARKIYEISAIFPLDLFPNKLIIDEAKVNIIYRGFMSRQVNSILIKDITEVIINSVWFMAGLVFNRSEHLKTSGPLSIPKLKNLEAQKARRIIMGMMIFSDQKVDTSAMTIPQIIQKAEELGRAQSQ